MGMIASDEWSEPAPGIGVRGVGMRRPHAQIAHPRDLRSLDRTGPYMSISMPWNPAEGTMHFAAHSRNQKISQSISASN
jgi:hypothetical protein